MPLDPKDEERLLRAMGRMLDERVGPIKTRQDKLSGKFVEVREEVSPAVMRRISESQHDIDDRSVGFERLVMSSLAATREEIAAVSKSIAPVATAATGGEAASIAGAHASIDSKTNSLAAKKSANKAVIIGVIQMILIAVWQAVQWLLVHG